MQNQNMQVNQNILGLVFHYQNIIDNMNNNINNKFKEYEIALYSTQKELYFSDKDLIIHKKNYFQ